MTYQKFETDEWLCEKSSPDAKSISCCPKDKIQRSPWDGHCYGYTGAITFTDEWKNMRPKEIILGTWDIMNLSCYTDKHGVNRCYDDDELNSREWDSNTESAKRLMIEIFAPGIKWR